MKLSVPWHWRQKPPSGTGLAKAPTGPQADLSNYLASFWAANEGAGPYIADLTSFPGQNLASSFGVAVIHDPSGTHNYWTSGPYGYAIQFGTSRYVESALSSNYDGNNGAVWFRFRAQASQSIPCFLFGRHDSSGSLNGITIYLDSGTPVISCQIKNNSVTTATLKGSVGLRDNAWHTVLVNFTRLNGGTNELWLDGELVTTANNSAAWSFNNQVLRWGIATDAFWQQFAGQIDLGGWITRKLTADEIFDLYLHPFDLMRSPGWVVMYPPGFPPDPIETLRHKSPKRAPRVPVPRLVW